jgi:O-antigen/teichoic acid export membrane protein
MANKGMGVILLPLYTYYLKNVAAYGALSLIDISINVLVEILILGQANSILMIGASPEYKGRKKSALFTIVSSLLLINIAFLVLGFIGISVLPFPIDPVYLFYTKLVLWIILFRVMNTIFFFQLRADEQSISYMAITLLKVLFSTSMIIYFVALRKNGINGVLYSYLIAEALTLLMLLPLMLRKMMPNFERDILSAAAKFGIPLIFSSIGILILNISDRYILSMLTDQDSVGLYNLGYSVAGVLNMFLIMPFNLTLTPEAFKIYGQPGDKRYYSKIMTYLAFILVWSGLALSLFSSELIKMFAMKSAYYPAYKVVPIIALAYILSAMRNVASLGMFLTKNTKIIAWLTLVAAFINIGLNFWLIPYFGMMAAAYNTLIAFVVYHILSQIFSQKYYRIPFENRKVVGILFLGCILYITACIIPDQGLIINVLMKIGMLILFPFIPAVFGFYEKVEIETMSKILRKTRNPIELIKSVAELKKGKSK